MTTSPVTSARPAAPSRFTTRARPAAPARSTPPTRPAMPTAEQLAAFGAELDAIRQRIIDDLGEKDAAYIRRVVHAQRAFEAAGRALFYLPPAWPLAVASLSVSKILDNMEIGHNVLHGQYDWMGDPDLNSRGYEWDTVCPSGQWKYSHNYIHHTYTNIVGRDRDLGYGLLRMGEEQRWEPRYLGNPLYAFLLMLLFEWGVLLHDLEVDRIVAGERTWADTRPLHRGMLRKVRNQTLKDYVLFPLLTGPWLLPTLAGDALANLVRNVWAFTIIFCGHFPTGVATFSEEETRDESRAHWYYRQLLGSANITGGWLFHVMTGNLSHQIEHHLFPDVPARRYPEIAAEVREICRRYGLPYNTGRLSRQFFSVEKKIFRFALPTAEKTTGPTGTAAAHRMADRVRGIRRQRETLVGTATVSRRVA
ncbi:fatty acid desaturase [Candidatus Protofrankia datiscae]|uniref:Fatty acid desaturase n=1 Tax=Candidatus Protofrankia datiscae TaxID=2716812 RepID=F8AWL2_9ACTN|nr:acyl-CoA desaturase [Candidatus Protofrankia datiscae]AEH09349.1 fatty acid desaturase [Candidatus Protofrankia datiscae]